VTKDAVEELDKRLGEFLEFPVQAHPSQDVNAALRIAELLQDNGYAFTLKDLNPKSLDSGWQALFRLGEREYSANDARPAVAICEAALAALEGAV